MSVSHFVSFKSRVINVNQIVRYTKSAEGIQLGMTAGYDIKLDAEEAKIFLAHMDNVVVPLVEGEDEPRPPMDYSRV